MYSCKWIILLLCFTASWSELAFSETSINLGYHNPIYSGYGLNLLFLNGNTGFEIGVGGLDAKIDLDGKDDNDAIGTSQDTDDNSGITLVGGLNGKYFFGSGAAKTYLQLGIGASIGAEDNEGSSASASTPYVGGGLWLGGSSLYVYGSYNITNHWNFIQAGLGFPI